MSKLAPEQEIEKLEESLKFTTQELEDARKELKQPPEWGNCIRGCEAAYLDRQGFCSPACHVGAPRGKYVTVAV